LPSTGHFEKPHVDLCALFLRPLKSQTKKLASFPLMDYIIFIYGGDFRQEENMMAALHNTVPGFLWDVPADLSEPAIQQRLSPTAIKAFFKIVSRWKVRDENARQLLGGISNGAFYQLKGGNTKRLDQDKLTRISLLIGIFKALHILYSGKLADAWVNLPNRNPIFAGEAPLSYINKGGILAAIRVRQLLDARRGGR
jgi:hypothetical protein